MKPVYPIVLTKGNKENFIVFIPDFNINTEGEDMTTAIEMARDAIGVVGIDMQANNEKLPIPSSMESIELQFDDAIITLVDIDFDDYRKKMI